MTEMPKGSPAEHHLSNMLRSADVARALIAKEPVATRCATAILSVVLHYERLLATRGRDPDALAAFITAMRSSGVFSSRLIEECRASVAARAPKRRLTAVGG